MIAFLVILTNNGVITSDNVCATRFTHDYNVVVARARDDIRKTTIIRAVVDGCARKTLRVQRTNMYAHNNYVHDGLTQQFRIANYFNVEIIHPTALLCYYCSILRNKLVRNTSQYATFTWKIMVTLSLRCSREITFNSNIIS